MDISQKKCAPCKGDTPPLVMEQANALLNQIPSWSIKNGHVFKQFKFKNFKESMEFVNKVAEIAELENHHPNITISYNRVGIELWTHAINGLSENDFIIPAKIDKIR